MYESMKPSLTPFLSKHLSNDHSRSTFLKNKYGIFVLFGKFLLPKPKYVRKQGQGHYPCKCRICKHSDRFEPTF